MIEREKFAWGVRRTLRPFNSPNRHAAVELTADVNKPQPGRVPDVGIRIANHRDPFSMPDLFILIQALQALRAEVGQEVQRMIENAKRSAATPVKKKTAKKK